jgi:NADH:ubiquinone oxidoreductase subunit C
MLYHNNAGSSVYVTQILLFFQPLFAFQVEKELYFKVTRTGIKKFLFFLKNHTQSLYKQLIDIYAIDSGEKLNRFEICYNLLSLE